MIDRGALAPILSLAGLIVAAMASLGLLSGGFDLGVGGGSRGAGSHRTPNPSVVFTPPPSPNATPPFVGTILFAQEGNIWSIDGSEVRQLSRTGVDSMPTWTPDGRSVVFV